MIGRRVTPGRRTLFVETETLAESVIDGVEFSPLRETVLTEDHLRAVSVLALLARVEIEVVLGIGA